MGAIRLKTGFEQKNQLKKKCNWYVLVTEENREIVKKWRDCSYVNCSANECYVGLNKNGKKDQWGVKAFHELKQTHGFSEITTEQFYDIIGYVKPIESEIKLSQPWGKLPWNSLWEMMDKKVVFRLKKEPIIQLICIAFKKQQLYIGECYSDLNELFDLYEYTTDGINWLTC